MVQKRKLSGGWVDYMFESSVVLDGTKTCCEVHYCLVVFESSVVLDGTKT